uniref:Uncharacterized protein n=1 Tax=Otus sunia TaxID=257818 RepID=A0A8C8B7A1_9STRI
MAAPATLRVVRCGGGTLHGARAVFSADAKYLLCASGDFVKMYSVATEKTLRVMGGHGDLVTGIQLNPHNHMQVWGGGGEGLAVGGAPAPLAELRCLRGGCHGCSGADWDLRTSCKRL